MEWLILYRNEHKTTAESIRQMLLLHEIKASVLAVDNDHAGNQCAIKNQDLRRIIPLNKDWNEDLIKEEQRYVYTKFKAKSKCDCTEMEKR